MQPGDLQPDIRFEPDPVAAPVVALETAPSSPDPQSSPEVGPLCLLWRAGVRDPAGQLTWELEVPDEEAAERFLPLERMPGEPYGAAWRRCRLAGQGEQGAAVAEEALRSGKGRYQIEFACRDRDGELRWLRED